MVSDNFPYVNRCFLSVCVDGLKVMVKPFSVRVNDGIPESGKFMLVESGIPLNIGSQNLGSTDKDWNPVPGIRNPRRGIQNSRLLGTLT